MWCDATEWYETKMVEKVNQCLYKKKVYSFVKLLVFVCMTINSFFFLRKYTCCVLHLPNGVCMLFISIVVLNVNCILLDLQLFKYKFYK